MYRRNTARQDLGIIILEGLLWVVDLLEVTLAEALILEF